MFTVILYYVFYVPVLTSAFLRSTNIHRQRSFDFLFIQISVLLDGYHAIETKDFPKKNSESSRKSHAGHKSNRHSLSRSRQLHWNRWKAFEFEKMKNLQHINWGLLLIISFLEIVYKISEIIQVDFVVYFFIPCFLSFADCSRPDPTCETRFSWRSWLRVFETKMCNHLNRKISSDDQKSFWPFTVIKLTLHEKQIHFQLLRVWSLFVFTWPLQ